MLHLEEMIAKQLIQPRTTNGGFNSARLDLDEAHMAYIVVQLTQAVGHATLLTVQRATDDAGDAVLVNNVKIYANESTAAGDANVRQADALNYTVDNAISNKVVIFQIDPASLGGTNNQVRIVVADSARATNFASIMGYIVPARYSA